jgi:hypothetical protein
VNRSDKWEEPQAFPVLVSNPEANPSLAKMLISDVRVTNATLIGICREIIFRQVANGYEFDLIAFTIDASTGALTLGKTLRVIDAGEDEAKSTLAIARAFDVPVYPDEPELSQELQRLYTALFEEGFTAPSGEGERMRLKVPSEERGLDYDTETSRWIVNPILSTSPGEALLAAAKASENERRFADAVRLVGTLRAAVDDLESLLDSKVRNENALQRCLTSYPILFGLNYQRVIPKYKLGSPYVMDYALEDVSGLVDLVEIESSSLPLYTQNGNPSHHLTHAEQQILDWLEWLEANARVARDDMPTMMRPMGQVVIGRRASMTPMDQRRFQRRNASWQGVMRLLTYDDVLDRGKNMLKILTSTSAEAEGVSGKLN